MRSSRRSEAGGRASNEMANRELPCMAASQTADVEDRAGGRHGTDDDADGAGAGDGAQ